MYAVVCRNKSDWCFELCRYTHFKITAALWKKYYEKKYDTVHIRKA